MEEVTAKEILALPMFPKYNTLELFIGQTRIITLKSAVYVHLDNGYIVSVYKVPVFTKYEVKGRKRIPIELVESHLKRCYQVGKYMLVTHETVKKYPLIDNIDKLKGEDFFNSNLYEHYL